MKAVPYPRPDHPVRLWPLRLHRLTVTMLWLLAGALAIYILTRAESLTSLIGLLSSAAILATLGSALCTVGSAFERDLVERIRLDIDILFKDIYEQPVQWRRWPFLRRREKLKLLNGDTTESNLRNPRVLLDVGTHIMQVDLPTVFEDFFDLPVIQNCWKLVRYRTAARTALVKRDPATRSPETQLRASDERMAYDCIVDIWLAIARFRLCRYGVHFGAALTLSTAVVLLAATPRAGA